MPGWLRQRVLAVPGRVSSSPAAGPCGVRQALRVLVIWIIRLAQGLGVLR